MNLNILSIYEGMEKEGLSWFVLWLHFLLVVLISELMIVLVLYMRIFFVLSVVLIKNFPLLIYQSYHLVLE